MPIERYGKMETKKRAKKTGVAAAMLVCISLLAACGKKNETIESLDTSKYVTLGEYSGMTVNVDAMQTVTDEIAGMFGFPKGIWVKEVAEGSAAEAAGIQVGDIIVKFDGQRMNTSADLQDAIKYFKAGETVNVTIKRAEQGKYETYELEVKLGSRPRGN